MPEKLFPPKVNFDSAFPQLSRPLRIGIVGGGRVAVVQSMAARLSDYWEVAAGALSSDPAKAAARGAQWRLPPERCYASFEEMAEREASREDGIDAVMIATPNHMHFAPAKAFLRAGIDVLCDKPLTNSLAEARELAQLADETGRVFGVCHAMAMFPMIMQAREMVAEGAIGEVVQIHAEFMQDFMLPPESAEAEHIKWRLDPAKSGATSCVGDIGTHAAHLAMFVSGLELTELRAEFHICGAPKALEDTAFMMTRYERRGKAGGGRGAGGGGKASGKAAGPGGQPKQVPGTLIASRIASGNRGGLRVRVYGSEGGIEWDMEHSEYLKYNKFGEPDAILSRGLGHGLKPKVERFARTGRGFPEGVIEAWGNLYIQFAMAVAARKDGLQPPPDWLNFPDARDGARGVAFIEASVESNKNGGAWVKCGL